MSITEFSDNYMPFDPKHFKTPPRQFGILPFWFINGEMKESEMDFQLQELHDKGLTGVILHARFGLSIAYLSKQWFSCISYILRKAKSLSLQIWIYDEYNWPSGTIAHTLTQEDKNAENRYLQLAVIPIHGKYFSFLEGTDSRYNDLARGEPIYACAISEKDFTDGNDKNIINLMPNFCFEKVVSWEAPEGEFFLLYFFERRADWYTDVLNENVSARFVKGAYQCYKENLSPEDFSSISGFYTDEPSMYYFEADRFNYSLPWSTNLIADFKSKNGYDLRQALPHLFFNLGSRSMQVRLDYYSTLTSQYSKNYFGQISNWCRKNGMQFTGHVMFEESLHRQVRTNGNLYENWKYFSTIGVDHLYPRVGTREKPEEHVALKLASSAAHQLGSQRVLCESLGGVFWDCTMERMKWIADWEYVLGINQFNPHGFHYSIEGERKRDWPPSQFYHHGWWRYYGKFNEYLSRAGYALTGRRHLAHVAMLYPIHTIWAHYTPQTADSLSQRLEAEFVYLTDALLRLHIDYDMIDESVLQSAGISSGKICIRNEAYSILLLPPLTHLDTKTFDAIERFIATGGHVIAIDTLAENGLHQGEIFPGRMLRMLSVPGCRFVSKCFHMQTLSVLHDVLSPFLPESIQIDSEEIFCLSMEEKDQKLYWIINPTPKAVQARLSFPGRVIPSLWNVEDGSITDLPVYQSTGNAAHCSWDFAAFGSALFVTRPGEDRTKRFHTEQTDLLMPTIKNGMVEGINEKASLSLSLNDFVFTTVNENALILDHWVSAEANQADLLDNPECWIPCKMGCWEGQSSFASKPKYPLDVCFAAEFIVRELPQAIALLKDGWKGETQALYCNGIQLDSTGIRSSFDAEIRSIPLLPALREGRNRLLLKLRLNSAYDGLMDLIKLVGNFALDETQAIVAPKNRLSCGSWTENGYPYYSGTGKYTCRFLLPQPDFPSRFLLHADPGRDTLSIRVNNGPLLTRLWNPYTMDITEFVRPGETNEITLEITNTLSNLLQGQRTPSGLMSAEIRCHTICCEPTRTLKTEV